MDEIWNQRLNQYQSKLLKYLRYVFNDHFVIALFFIFGAICYGYFNFIDSIRSQTISDHVVVIIALMIILQIGQLATLMQKPDIVFLLPNDYRISDYLVKARHHSMTMTALMQFGCGLITVPFLVHVLKYCWYQWIILLISQVIFKWGQLLFQEMKLFNLQWHSIPFRLCKQGIPLMGIVVGIFISPIITLIIAGIYWLGMLYIRSRKCYCVFHWQNAINSEERRVIRIYKFFNLFTNVPEVHQKVKRRRYLDCILPRYCQDSRQTYNYLYWRGFWRNSEYSGLFIRITLIGMLLMAFIDLKWVNFLIGILFIYLTEFQLLPLANQFYDIVFTHLYPLNVECQIRSFRKVLAKVGSIQTILFALVSFYSTRSLLVICGLLVASVLVNIFIGSVYLRKRFSEAA